MRAAHFKHSLAQHRDGTMTVRVLPGDGRYPEEFRATPAELRRFAWALLADLDPSEEEIARDAEMAEHAESCGLELTSRALQLLERHRA